jgi:hypothetical protein
VWAHDEAAAHGSLAARAGGADALLVTGPPRMAPRQALPGPFVTAPDGRRIPAGWLPLETAGVGRFCAALTRVHRRRRERRSVAVLGQWHPRYLRLASRIGALLEPVATPWQWTSDVLDRDDLGKAMGAGLGLGIYVGHGRPIGWVGYRGLRAHHLDDFAGEPLGSLVSLCCETASRRRTRLSFGEAIPLAGVAAASVAAVGPTRHTDNTRWAVGLCQALVDGAGTVGELIVRSAPRRAESVAAYRIIGDPLAPILSDAAADRRARRVPVFA